MLVAGGGDPRAVLAAARARADRRARRAHPLAGARRGRRAPARLRPADARADAEARRRPARGRDARPPPGARAARLAQRRRERRTGRSRPRCRPRPPRSRRRTAPPSRSSPSATAPLDAGTEAVAAAAREALTNAAKFAPDAADLALRRDGRRRVEVFVRDRGPGFDPAARPGRPPRAARVRRRAHGAPRRHAPPSTPRPGAGTEVELTL